MTEDEYVESRLHDQIAWYNKKSAFNQNRYKTLRVVEILLATSVPFLTGFISDSSFSLARSPTTATTPSSRS
jgi:hypothetical protein